ncbi:expressed protein [Dictyostelium purpureum]|uniref:Expressed protein n=1 Tax=Dictyostelium purpureum TaxID=5786 RepID=F0ZLZ9_DICPU|nr:uncharacterized protein DICPUDRAFT_152671 [Dictyostelium purpureum]EGC35013.1 expressed protein [Dictyostelium purpureum]|eukprot:XP_003288441.1 expressed protein [Dictyostelium purpureum]
MSILKSITSLGNVSKSSSVVASGGSIGQQSNNSVAHFGHGIAGAGGKQNGTVYYNKTNTSTSETYYTSGQQSGGYGYAF